jgi:hypothetical protein
MDMVSVRAAPFEFCILAITKACCISLRFFMNVSSLVAFYGFKVVGLLGPDIPICEGILICLELLLFKIC